MDKILLTRPQELSQKIAKDLSRKNLSSLIQPLFSIINLVPRCNKSIIKNAKQDSHKLTKLASLTPKQEDLEQRLRFDINNPNLQSKKIQAILITSQNAIFALTQLAIEKNVLILTISKKTALAVKNLGYQNTIFANNSANSLLNLAKETLTNNLTNDDLVIYLSGEIITLDLAKKLQNLGFLAEKIVVYKTRESAELLPKTISEIIAGNVTEIWFYSKNTVKIFYKLAKKYNLLKYLKQIKILCLSKEISSFANKIGFLNVAELTIPNPITEPSL
jgi:uroporphyrinogen-III synthase